MDNQQLAHDLAIAKLAGTDLPPNKFIEQYRKFKDEFSELLSNEEKTRKIPTAKIMPSPI